MRFVASTLILVEAAAPPSAPAREGGRVDRGRGWHVDAINAGKPAADGRGSFRGGHRSYANP